MIATLSNHLYSFVWRSETSFTRQNRGGCWLTLQSENRIIRTNDSGGCFGKANRALDKSGSRQGELSCLCQCIIFKTLLPMLWNNQSIIRIYCHHKLNPKSHRAQFASLANLSAPEARDSIVALRSV